jgi:hypothetical protein
MDQPDYSAAEKRVSSQAHRIVGELSRSSLAVPDIEPFSEQLAPYVRLELLQAELNVANKCGLMQMAVQLVEELSTCKKLIQNLESARKKHK